MFQQALQTHLQQLVNFLQYAKAYFIRSNPLKAMLDSFVTALRDILMMNKKIKMARYRLNYQKYKLSQYEKLIAQNNEHTFLRGRTLNETR